MWGSLSMDANGRTSVSFLESNDYVVLNTSTPTHFYLVGAGLWNILDLSIASNSIARHCFTEVTNELLGSDHSITSINLNHVQPTINTFLPRWNLSKA